MGLVRVRVSPNLGRLELCAQLGSLDQHRLVRVRVWVRARARIRVKVGLGLGPC